MTTKTDRILAALVRLEAAGALDAVCTCLSTAIELSDNVWEVMPNGEAEEALDDLHGALNIGLEH